MNNFRPNLAMIIVKKRINTRFFKPAGPKLVNPLPGTVVDSYVTKQEWYGYDIARFYYTPRPNAIGDFNLGFWDPIVLGHFRLSTVNCVSNLTLLHFWSDLEKSFLRMPKMSLINTLKKKPLILNSLSLSLFKKIKKQTQFCILKFIFVFLGTSASLVISCYEKGLCRLGNKDMLKLNYSSFIN